MFMIDIFMIVIYFVDNREPHLSVFQVKRRCCFEVLLSQMDDFFINESNYIRN